MLQARSICVDEERNFSELLIFSRLVKGACGMPLRVAGSELAAQVFSTFSDLVRLLPNPGG